jgi:serine/threonine protein kinase
VVYRARQREPRRDVALKMLSPRETGSDEMRARFRFETDVVATLDHRAILPVHVVGEYRGMPYFTMKLATGGTLIDRGMALWGYWREIAELVATIADAVHYAHTRGVIHRDLKPGNVLFDSAGHPYVSDFGLAQYLAPERDVAKTGAQLGTPAYLAPEIVEHGGAAASTATDVYGLGAILYELLCGRTPFVAESLPDLLRQITDSPLPSTGGRAMAVPRDLDVIATRCLAKDPAQRLASAAEVADELRRWLAGRPIHSRAIGPAERVWRWSRRNPALATISALFISSLILGGAELIDRNVRLTRSNERAVKSERTAREQLQASLVSEARITRRTGRVGQRTSALTLLDQAAALGPSERLRSEYIATLASNDLTIDRRLPGATARSDDTMDFSPDLARYLEADPVNGAVERDTATRAVLRKFSGRPGSSVWYLAYGSDGKTVLAAYRDGCTEIWPAVGADPSWSGGEIYGGDKQPSPLALHPAGKDLLKVEADDGIAAIDLPTGKKTAAIAAAGEIRLLSFNPAGTILLVVHRDRAVAWSWPERKRLWSFAAPMSPARPAWTHDGRRVAVGVTGRDDIAMLEAGTGAVERLFAAHGDDGRLLAFQPGGRLLASVGWDGSLVLIDAFGGEVVLQREAWVRTLRFSADGRQLAFSSSHVEAVTATLANIGCLREMGHELMGDGVPCRVAVSPDGRTLATTDFNELRFWNTDTGQLVSRHVETAKEWSVAAYTPAGDALIQSRRFSGMRRWPVMRSGEETRLGVPEPVGAPGPADLARVHKFTGDWWILRFPTGQLVRWPQGRPEDESSVLTKPGLDGPTVSPDGRLLLMREFPKEGVAVVEADGAREIARLPTGKALSAAFTPDGAWVITGTSREYALWKAGTWERGPAWPVQIDGGAYPRADFSPDGSLVALAQEKGVLELREARGYRPLLQLELPQKWWINHFAWSPAGDRLYVLCPGHRVLYWDLTEIRRELTNRKLNW